MYIMAFSHSYREIGTSPLPHVDDLNSLLESYEEHSNCKEYYTSDGQFSYRSSNPSRQETGTHYHKRWNNYIRLLGQPPFWHVG